MYVTVLFPFKMYRDVKIQSQRHQWKKILAILHHRHPKSLSQKKLVRILMSSFVMKEMKIGLQWKEKLRK